jgi:hypothetical protein
MKRIIALAGLLFAASLAWSGPALAQGNECAGGALPGMVVGGTSGACYYANVDSAGAVKVVGTVTPSSTPAPQQLGITPTDRTITSASGASETVMAANASRHSLIIQNTGNANCGVNPTGGTAAIGGAGTLTLFPGGSYQPRVPTLSAVTAICTAAQPLYAEEN